MADLTLATAESLGKTRVAAGTYIEAFPGFVKSGAGTPCIHALMPVTSTNGGGWVEVTTDA
jgi:hypothetical protein